MNQTLVSATVHPLLPEFADCCGVPDTKVLAQNISRTTSGEEHSCEVRGLNVTSFEAAAEAIDVHSYSMSFVVGCAVLAGNLGTKCSVIGTTCMQCC
jgi:hypothetical protein